MVRRPVRRIQMKSQRLWGQTDVLRATEWHVAELRSECKAACTPLPPLTPKVAPSSAGPQCRADSQWGSPVVCFSSAEGCCVAGLCPSRNSPPGPGGPWLSPGQRCHSTDLSSAAAWSAAASGGSFLPGPPVGDKASINRGARWGKEKLGTSAWSTPVLLLF